MNLLKNSLIVIILSALSLNGMTLANENQTLEKDFNSRKLKISSSISNLMAVGDLNIKAERSIRPKISAVASIHYLTDKSAEDENPFKYPDFRVTAGLRTYLPTSSFLESLRSPFLGKLYLSMLAGVNQIEDKTIPSIEIWIGTQKDINEYMFYEMGAGIGRLLAQNELGTVEPLGTLTLGIKL
ncbi:hypothetical protein DID80_00395 [Candidatus Marinamargulisbacteria bacterium SCGC AAA071-K20]|nr:hypothetical protein DID80_00395 [Candidatus Marinamargulisbacteria bacterium SCGC AAA071-K20]